MTKEQLVDLLPGIDPDDVADALGAFHHDQDEGADWIPFYKMALCRLVQSAAALRALVELLSDEATLTPRQKKSMAAILIDAGRAYRDHLVLCGVGPDFADEERLADVRVRVREATKLFMKRTR